MRTPQLRQRRLALAAIAVVILAGSAMAAGMLAVFSESIAAVTSGGGSSESATYTEVQSAIGQTAVGPSSSETYAENAGAAQNWDPPRTSVNDWRTSPGLAGVVRISGCPCWKRIVSAPSAKGPRPAGWM